MPHKTKQHQTYRISHIPQNVRNEILKELEGKPSPSDKEVYLGELQSVLTQRPELNFKIEPMENNQKGDLKW